MQSHAKHKPVVCLIDEDANVKKGWEKALGQDVKLIHYSDHLSLMNSQAKTKELVKSFSCVVVGRYFKESSLDITATNLANHLRQLGSGPVFLNWQGFVSKNEVKVFDGKLFHRYGVKWQTLKLRIQKFDKSYGKSTLLAHKSGVSEKYAKLYEGVCKENAAISNFGAISSKNERCMALLKEMAQRAEGAHKDKIEFYASQDLNTGFQLLEAIYNRLITDKNRPDSCPSRYINSSPVVAQKILYETLYG